MFLLFFIKLPSYVIPVDSSLAVKIPFYHQRPIRLDMLVQFKKLNTCFHTLNDLFIFSIQLFASCLVANNFIWLIKLCLLFGICFEINWM